MCGKSPTRSPKKPSVPYECPLLVPNPVSASLLTDGVVEARTKKGELFGFDRTASISILSAEHIAATAAAFGQQDDITVLKIRGCHVP
jgi:hypothetical protein